MVGIILIIVKKLSATTSANLLGVVKIQIKFQNSMCRNQYRQLGLKYVCVHSYCTTQRELLCWSHTKGALITNHISDGERSARKVNGNIYTLLCGRRAGTV